MWWFWRLGEEEMGGDGMRWDEMGSLLGDEVVNRVETRDVERDGGRLIFAVLVHETFEVLLAPAYGDDGGAIGDDFGCEGSTNA